MAATKTKLGFALTCPFCGDSEQTVKLDLNDLRKLECTGCGEEFTAEAAWAKAVKMAEQWNAVVEWIEKANELV